MSIMTDVLVATPDRHPAGHPGWCDRALCSTAVDEDGAIIVDHRRDFSVICRDLDEHTTAAGMTARHIHHQGRLEFEGLPQVYVVGASRAELERATHLGSTHRMLVEIAVEHAIEDLTGITMSPFRALSEQAVANVATGATR